MKCYCCKKDFPRNETLPTCIVYPNRKPARICKECEREFERQPVEEEKQQTTEPEACPNCGYDMHGEACSVCAHVVFSYCECPFCAYDDDDWDDDEDDF